ncbi:hypothetical protein [Acrocarpospora catenulata]|uniref:hypothetical protein n=1 Tax=Acrocarpospora catenulata TaxID=2836182 RepID=UPI001BDB2B9A|nr:hypothetical protein [Acrocarpospora catenulata]
MNRSLIGCVGALVVVYLAGAAIAVDHGLNPTYLDALGTEGRLAAPIPMIILQLLAVALSVNSRRGLALTGSGLLAVACSAAVISGFFDGGYTDPRLSTFDHGYQIAMIAGIAALGLLGAIQFTRRLRSNSTFSRVAAG